MYAEMQQQLAEEPPVDWFAAAYFRGNKWWEPPGRPAAENADAAGADAAGAAAVDAAADEDWEFTGLEE